MADLQGARVGVIGGSGLYSIPGLRQVEERAIKRHSELHPMNCDLESWREFRPSS